MEDAHKGLCYTIPDVSYVVRRERCGARRRPQGAMLLIPRYVLCCEGAYRGMFCVLLQSTPTAK